MKSCFMLEDNNYHIIPKNRNPMSLNEIKSDKFFHSFCEIGFATEVEAWLSFKRDGWLVLSSPMRAVFTKHDASIHLIPFDEAVSDLNDADFRSSPLLTSLSNNKNDMWEYAFSSLWLISNYYDVIVYSSKDQGDHAAQEFYRLAGNDVKLAFDLFKACEDSKGEAPSVVFKKLFFNVR